MAQLDDLPPLREIIAAHGLSAVKALGQNFLLDLNLTAKIARAAGSLEDHHIIEIGPGPGGLTRALLACGARHVTAIEMDRRCLPALESIAKHYPGKLDVIEGDALKIDLAAIAGGQPCRIVANLPYNVATPLIVGWLTAPTWPPFFASITVMVQREVAERLVATPSVREDHGRLSVLAGWRTEARILFDVPPQAFLPPPKVTSSIIQMIPRPAPLPCSLTHLQQVTMAAFGQRRKMLRQSLKPLGDPLGLLVAAGIAEEARAETVDVAGFVRLANALAAR
ncbi:MAG: 16S rRNA (adenine(1518)-N(6)/adenine(1519)-N(6))-dimethyltransferase RsmA [Beijerinckiaceae bacterium]